MKPSMSLRSFIEKLESEGDLRRISAEVDPFLEITEITNRVHNAFGPALLFEKVKGSPFPLLINAFGSYKRMQMALNCESFEEIATRIESYMKLQAPKGLREKIKMLYTLKEVSNILPKEVKHAPCH